MDEFSVSPERLLEFANLYGHYIRMARGSAEEFRQAADWVQHNFVRINPSSMIFYPRKVKYEALHGMILSVEKMDRWARFALIFEAIRLTFDELYANLIQHHTDLENSHYYHILLGIRTRSDGWVLTQLERLETYGVSIKT